MVIIIIVNICYSVRFASESRSGRVGRLIASRAGLCCNPVGLESL